jgi:hypothetical protein
MKTTDDIFRDAQTLALFANLEPQDVEEFRHNYPDYVPDSWWSASVVSFPKLWVAIQSTLRDAWKNQFPLENCIRLINAGMVAALPNLPGVPSPEWIAASVIEATVQQARQFGILKDLAGDTWVQGQKVWPYQRAVMFLGTRSWQADQCLNCRKLFVKDKASRHYCSDKCFQDSRKLAKRSWWDEHGQQLRNRQRRAKSRAKGKP